MEGLDYFKSSFDDVNFYDENGNVIINKEEYFKKRKESMLTYNEPLIIGDVVKLKTTGDIIIVKNVNYEIMGLVYDYAGVRIDEHTGNLLLFCQEDIEEKIEQKKVKR